MIFWPQFSPETRRAQYAGSWYEANPEKLQQELESYIHKASTSPDQESNSRIHVSSQPIRPELLAIIVPHAGYLYSGQTAAFAYKSAQGQNFKRIILLGPSHHIGFRGAALADSVKFATPLGDLEVDRDCVKNLKSSPYFAVHADVHKIEHSLELQLPFIRHCFDQDLKIVPIVIGQLSNAQEAKSIGAAIKKEIRKGDLIVVSSDFTHYGPRYGYMPFGLDPSVPNKICKLDGEAFEQLSKLDLNGFVNFLNRTGDTICGMFPCQVLLSILPPKSHATLLKYACSRDMVGEDQNNSVSYLSVAFSGAAWTDEDEHSKHSHNQSQDKILHLSKTEQESLLKLARKTMETFVKEKRSPSPQELGIEITDTMKENFGVFVTINKRVTNSSAHEKKELRGCIGNIMPVKALYQAVQENAINACSHDYRFTAVQSHELADLQLDINILSRPQRIGSYHEIVIGRDGVILSKGGRQAVFLPQVAVEWKWTLEEMLSQLSLKAGLGPNDWRQGASFDTFQSEEIKEN
ncbi:MAG: AmmeMemoRadiSam system protein B [Candidatus Obscuribacterales bacterium]|nr:AmmeMemoRadiSam system protein B [Candidatus Obscuribacterales bacterium]